MMKLVGFWAFMALVTAALTYKVMNPTLIENTATFSLSTVQIEIENRFETVDHISANALAAMDETAVVIFDTRPPTEYAVSHIKNAVRLNPDISPTEFSRNYLSMTKGKTVVFYCSVGMRSSNVAARITGQLQETTEVYNLRGGVFGWHNEDRPLVTVSGETDAIHPYDKTWGQLITRQDKLSYK